MIYYEQDYQKDNPMTTPHLWIPQQEVKDHAIRAYGDMMLKMHNAVSILEHVHHNARQIRIAATICSTELRKLLLKERLLENILQERQFHPLFTPRNVDPIDFTTQLSDGTQIYECHHQIQALPGAQPRSDYFTRWDFHTDIFKEEISPQLTLESWLDQPMILVKTESPAEKTQSAFTLGHMLTYVANKEGAHYEDPDNPREVKYLTYPKHMRILGDQKSFPYAHWIVLSVSIYLVNRQHAGINTYPTHWNPYLRDDAITALSHINHLHFSKVVTPFTTPIPPAKYAKQSWLMKSAVQ